MHKNDFSILGFNVLNPNRISEVTSVESKSSENPTVDTIKTFLKLPDYIKNNPCYSSKVKGTLIVKIAELTSYYLKEKIPLKKLAFHENIFKNYKEDGDPNGSSLFLQLKKLERYLQNSKHCDLLEKKFSFLTSNLPSELYIKNTYKYLQKSIHPKDFVKIVAFYGKVILENKEKPPIEINKLFFEEIIEKFYFNDTDCPFWLPILLLQQSFISIEMLNTKNPHKFFIKYHFPENFKTSNIRKVSNFFYQIYDDCDYLRINIPEEEVTALCLTFSREIDYPQTHKKFILTPTFWNTSLSYSISSDIPQISTLIKTDFIIPYYFHNYVPITKEIVENLSFGSLELPILSGLIPNIINMYEKSFPVNHQELMIYKQYISLNNVYKKVGFKKFDGFIPKCILQNGKKQEILIKALALNLKNIKPKFANYDDVLHDIPSGISFHKNCIQFVISNIQFSIELKNEETICNLNFISKEQKSFNIPVKLNIDLASNSKNENIPSMLESLKSL